MKTVEEIYENLLKDFQKRIGREVRDNCDLAVRLYAVAAQIQALQLQTEWTERQAFPQTAEGQMLDYHAEMRGLRRGEAMCAEGMLLFSLRENAAEAVEVPEGTVCLNGAGTRYITLEMGKIPAGEKTVRVFAKAMDSGAKGNCTANTILFFSVPPAGVVSCTNPEAFSGGMDAETDERLRERIMDTFHRLPNGANAAFYETEALRVSGAAAAKAIGRARGIGTVDVYVAAHGGVPSEELLKKVQDTLSRKREIAVDVQVKAPKVQAVSLNIALKPRTGVDYESVRRETEQKLRGYFTGERLGEAVLLSKLHHLLQEVEGAENYHLLAPYEDVPPAVDTLPVLGTLTISAMQ